MGCISTKKPILPKSNTNLPLNPHTNTIHQDTITFNKTEDNPNDNPNTTPNAKPRPTINTVQTNNDTNLLSSDIINPKPPSALPLLSSSEVHFIKDAFNQHFLFKDKSDIIIDKLIAEIKLVPVKGDSVLFTKGDQGDMFYIIKSGMLEVIIDESTVKLFYPKMTFGELALLERRPRTATVRCLEKDAELYALDGNSFRNILKTINQGELKERLMFLSLVPILKSLDTVQLNSIASSMLRCSFDIGQRIIRAGEAGDSLYIIRIGEVTCMKDNVVIRVLKSKDFFGEYAVLFDTKRTMSVFAKQRTTCYHLSNEMLRDILGSEYKHVILKAITKESLINSKHLKVLAEERYLSKIFINYSIQLYQDNQVILKAENANDIENSYMHTGDKEQMIFVLISGNAINSINGIVLATRGELFGEEYIKTRCIVESNIIAQGECRLIAFEWNKILNILNLGMERKKTLSFFSQFEYMKKTQLFKNNSDYRLMLICKVMTKEKFSPGKVIVKEGDIGEKFYLIKKGKVNVYKEGKFLREMEEGNCFGEMSLIINERRSATITTITNVTLYTLTKASFTELMDKNLLSYLTKKISLEDSSNNSLEDFYLCRNLGQGKFGNVTLVHNNHHHYALKAVSRKAADKQRILIKYFLEERRVLLKLDHPFVMKLVKTLKTNDNVFYLTEYVNGKVMGKYLENKQPNSFNDKYETQFYISFLFVVLDYLNSKSVIHRDLKPDNIMIDDKGYVKVIDFGTAMEIKNFTSTITGTPHYIGPEVLTGKGYSFSCDYWSIGVIAHEIYYNSYPFGNDACDPMEIYKEVLKKEPSLPKHGPSDVNSMIRILLKKKVTDRLCSLEKAKEHCFFKGFDWNDLVDFKLVPPYIPKMHQLKEFEEYNMKYLDYFTSLKEEKEKKRKGGDESLLSACDNEGIGYDTNWADEF